MSESSDLSVWIPSLAERLQHLSQTAEEQQEYLRKLGVNGSADELALEFDDIFRPLEPLLSESPGWSHLLKLLLALDQELGKSELRWSTESLVESQSWKEVRRLAREALAVLRSTPMT